MSLRYEKVTEPLSGSITINAWDDENGILYSIPTDLANADYQAYLNKDNPQVGISTPIVSGEDN